MATVIRSMTPEEAFDNVMRAQDLPDATRDIITAAWMLLIERANAVHELRGQRYVH
jgi:hypothetical protein